MSALRRLVAVFLIIGLVPFLVESPFWLNACVFTLYAALLGQSWNILAGYGGQFSFGHALFFGVGAYTAAVLQVQFGINPWVTLLAGGLAASAVAIAVGYLSFRYGLRGSYFALVTLAFAEVFRILTNSLWWTGAGEGIMIALDQRPIMLQFTSQSHYFWLIWAITFACFAVVWTLEHSRFGACLMAVRDNEEAAAAIGVDAFATKLRAMGLSGLFTGLAGVFYAQKFLYLDPAIAFGPAVSVESLLVPIVGGLGTLFGPLFGAVALHAVGEVTRELIGDAPGLNMIVFGCILIAMVMFLPRGLSGLGRIWWRSHA